MTPLPEVPADLTLDGILACVGFSTQRMSRNKTLRRPTTLHGDSLVIGRITTPFECDLRSIIVFGSELGRCALAWSSRLFSHLAKDP